MTPHLLSEFRSALVNNQFLATAACSLDLHLHLEHLSIPLAKALMDFTSALDEKLQIIGMRTGNCRKRDYGHFRSMTFASGAYRDTFERSKMPKLDSHISEEEDETDSIVLEDESIDDDGGYLLNLIPPADIEEIEEVDDLEALVLHDLMQNSNSHDSLDESETETSSPKLDEHGLRALFWEDLITAPKAAGDILESLIGAVYLDSGLRMEKVWDVIDRVLIKRWWSRFELSRELNTGSVDKNPVKEYLDIIQNDFHCTESYIK